MTFRWQRENDLLMLNVWSPPSFLYNSLSLFHSVPLCSLLLQDSPQIPVRNRLPSETERFTFGSVSSGRGTEEESSSCFDYTSDQVSLCCFKPYSGPTFLQPCMCIGRDAKEYSALLFLVGVLI